MWGDIGVRGGVGRKILRLQGDVGAQGDTKGEVGRDWGVGKWWGGGGGWGGGYGGHWEEMGADKGHKPSLPHPEELPSLPVTPSDPGAR